MVGLGEFERRADHEPDGRSSGSDRKPAKDTDVDNQELWTITTNRHTPPVELNSGDPLGGATFLFVGIVRPFCSKNIVDAEPSTAPFTCTRRLLHTDLPTPLIQAGDLRSTTDIHRTLPARRGAHCHTGNQNRGASPGDTPVLACGPLSVGRCRGPARPGTWRFAARSATRRCSVRRGGRTRPTPRTASGPPQPVRACRGSAGRAAEAASVRSPAGS